MHSLMMVNKIMEKVTCKMIVSDMKNQMDPTQFGNRKGVSIQHYLVKMLDRVISALDRNSKGEAVAVIATMIDWKQAFPLGCSALALGPNLSSATPPTPQD